MKIKVAAILMIGIGLGLSGCSMSVDSQQSDKTVRAKMRNIDERSIFLDKIDETAEVYSAIKNVRYRNMPEDVLNNARCIAVIPNVVTGAFIVGGTHGKGLVSCRVANTGTGWSQPAALSLNQGSIGLQAGAKSTDLVLFFQSKAAEQALKRGDFSLGSDISVVAGNFDKKIDTSKAGIIAFARTEGLFAGVSLNGSKIGRNQSLLNEYYGTNVNYTNILNGKENPDSQGYTERLTKLFP